MIKLVYCVTRKPGLSRDDFIKTWLHDHGPLVKQYAKAIRAVRYVQSHTMITPINDALQESRGCEPPYDGITEVWWNSLAELEAGLATEEGQVAHLALRDDEARFIDLSRSRVFMSEENPIF